MLLRCPPLACARNYDEYTPFTSYYKKTRRSGKKIKNKVQFGENSTGGSKHDQRASAETNSRSKKTNQQLGTKAKQQLHTENDFDKKLEGDSEFILHHTP